jgi:hypothetical protein
MATRIPARFLMIASLCMPASESRLAAQVRAQADGIHACDLLSSADVRKVTGRASRKPPSPLVEAQNKWSHCSYRDAAVLVGLFSRAATAQKYVDQEVAVAGLDDARHAVAGVRDSAAIYYRAKGKDPRGLLIAYAGTRALTVQVDMDPGQPSESARPYAVALAKIALGKLK